MPIMDYGNVMYDCLNANDSHTLKKIQNCAFRIIPQCYFRTHIVDMHNELNTMYLADRRHAHTLNQVYKCINDLSPPHINQEINLVHKQHPVQTRAAANLVAALPNVRLETSRRVFKYRGQCLWNLLDDDMEKKLSIDSFKRVVYNSDLFEAI